MSSNEEQSHDGEWGWEALGSEDGNDTNDANETGKDEHPAVTYQQVDSKPRKNFSERSFNSKKNSHNNTSIINNATLKGITSSPSFQELEMAIGAALNSGDEHQNSSDNLKGLSPNTSFVASRFSSTNITQQKLNQQRIRQQQHQMRSSHSGPRPIPHQTSNNASYFNIVTPSFLAKSELSSFINEPESRAMIIFHSPQISPYQVRTACLKYGLLYYIRPEFHSKGVTFISYFDLRAAINAKSSIHDEMGVEAEASAHYSVMLHGANSNSEEFRIILSKLPANKASEADVLEVFSRYGQVRQILKTLTSKDNVQKSLKDADQKSIENTDDSASGSDNNCISYNVEFYNIQDSRLAVSELSATSSQIWQAETTVMFAPLDERKGLLCRSLLSTMSKWRTEMPSNHPIPPNGALMYLPGSSPVSSLGMGIGMIRSTSHGTINGLLNNNPINGSILMQNTSMGINPHYGSVQVGQSGNLLPNNPMIPLVHVNNMQSQMPLISYNADAMIGFAPTVQQHQQAAMMNMNMNYQNTSAFGMNGNQNGMYLMMPPQIEHNNMGVNLNNNFISPHTYHLQTPVDGSLESNYNTSDSNYRVQIASDRNLEGVDHVHDQSKIYANHQDPRFRTNPVDSQQRNNESRQDESSNAKTNLENQVQTASRQLATLSVDSNRYETNQNSNSQKEPLQNYSNRNFFANQSNAGNKKQPNDDENELMLEQSENPPYHQRHHTEQRPYNNGQNRQGAYYNSNQPVHYTPSTVHLVNSNGPNQYQPNSPHYSNSQIANGMYFQPHMKPHHHNGGYSGERGVPVMQHNINHVNAPQVYPNQNGVTNNQMSNSRKNSKQSTNYYNGMGSTSYPQNNQTAHTHQSGVGDGDFALDLNRIEEELETRTTIMVRNIPNKYNQQMLLDEVNISHEGTYDFFYLPIDFKNRCNVGYCFINFLDPKFIAPFVREFNGQRWKSFNSEKICAVSFARIQGKNAMIARFQNSSLLEKDDEYQPLLFISTGPDRGKPEPFPTGNRHRVAYNSPGHNPQSNPNQSVFPNPVVQQENASNGHFNTHNLSYGPVPANINPQSPSN